MDARAQSIDQKIKLIDQQLAKSRDQIKKIRPGPSQDAVKKRALIILKQKKMYEHQRDQLYSQQYNVDSVAFATENAKATVDTVRAMKAASKELKTQFKQKEFDIDKIDSLNDQMADLLEYNEEVQEVLGQSYATPEDIDEDGLMDELDALELDLEEDLENEIGNGEIPSYLRDDPLPAAPEEKPLGAMPNAPSEKVPEAPAHATNAGEVPPQKETAEKVWYIYYLIAT